ncbi:MAG: flavodoxin family protein [Hominenteromicrobium sp.]
MKILVLNGSPKTKSDTMRLTDAFLRGMSAAGAQTVKTLRAIDLQVKPCLGCFGCWRPGAAGCVQQDDMAQVLHDFLEAELVIFSFPLYCYGMPAPLKAVMDRMIPLVRMDMVRIGDRIAHVSRYDLDKKRYLMISGCGFPAFKGNFDPAVAQFRCMFGQDAQAICVPEAPMLNVPDAAPLADPLLAKFEQAGKRFAETGLLTPETIAELETPMIPADTYMEIVNGNGK